MMMMMMMIMMMCRLQEKHVLEMQCKHQRNILELQEKLKFNLQQVCRRRCLLDIFCVCSASVYCR